MGRHAYLIMAHHQWSLLKTLISLLDDKRNDIYIHVDKKADEVPFTEIKNAAKISKLVFVDRISVDRGSFSLFEAEMILLRAALHSAEYSYFHLLSGQDLPLKNQDYIHEFFEKHDGRNFIDVITPEHMKKEWYERVSLYQVFSRYINKASSAAVPVRCIRKILLKTQKTFCVNRFKKYEEMGFVLCFGSNWFSITKEFAVYIAENYGLIKDIFCNYTFAPEELILQTFLWSSPIFKDTLYDSQELNHKVNRANLRAIFWNGKASPEIITMERFKTIQNTMNLYARKFDNEIAADAVEAAAGIVKTGR